MNAVDVDFSLLPEVICEVQEHLPQLEHDLHHLVQTPDSVDLLSSAFRHLHTIKGDLAYCHAAPIVAFVHQLEDVMQTLRDRVFLCSALVAEALLQSMEQVNSMMMTLEETGVYDTTPRETLLRLISVLAKSRDQRTADETARLVLLTIHGEWRDEAARPAMISSVPAASIDRALIMGKQLAEALALRHPAWRNRAASQCELVLALNRQYLRPCDTDMLLIAVYWHDVGLLASADTFLDKAPTTKSPDWPLYVPHAERAASWLLTIAPECTEAAQIIRQHHLGVNGTGIAAPAYPANPHPGALMVACADMLFERVNGLSGDDYRRGVMRTIFDVSGGLETRFDAFLINAFEAVAPELKPPTDA